MPDQSYLDERYFVDGNVYNCPFCNRRHVAYDIYDIVQFDWTDKKPCAVYFIRCCSCGKRSMHLTFILLYKKYESKATYHWSVVNDKFDIKKLDKNIFYSVPTSFFVLDERVPQVLRELLTEAEGCLKSNYLTGASVCARKIIYELGKLNKAAGDNYKDRIESLKDIHPEVDPTFFDTLLTIQQVTSTKVHENSFDGWEAKHLRVILATLKEVLHEIYVVPALRQDRRQAILSLKDELIPQQQDKKSGNPQTQAPVPAQT